MSESIRDRVVRLIKEMRNRTTERGATPAEAAGFAAKVASWIEKYQIEEAELASQDGREHLPPEMCREFISTGKRVFNPGMTAIVSALSRGSSCRVVLTHDDKGRAYGIIGAPLDSEYVRQMSATLLTLLRDMATLEGHEHGYEKAGLVRWCNQYLMAAGDEIYLRLVSERNQRSKVKEIEHLEKQATTAAPTGSNGALTVITGNTLAKAKMEAATAKMNEFYPVLGKGRSSQSGYIGAAQRQGREAGRSVGLGRAIR